MIRNQIFSIARAACQPDDSHHCEQVVVLLEEIVYISCRSLKNCIFLTNRYLKADIDRHLMEDAFRSDMELLERNIRLVNKLCEDFDCEDLGDVDADQFTDRFIEEIIASRKQMC